MGYLAYEISLEDEKRLQEIFPPKYPTLRANHITICEGNSETPLPPAALAEIIGYADDGVGIEAVIVTIDGEAHRKIDGRAYHITMSYDPTKLAPAEFDPEPDPAKKKAQPYRGVHSNALIERKGYKEISIPFNLHVVAKYYESATPLPGARFGVPELK